MLRRFGVASGVAQLKSVINKIVKRTNLTRQELLLIGNFAKDVIVKRTRLGYGVSETGGIRKSLKQMRRHSIGYTQFRLKNSKSLSKFTAAKKHNLTFSGQLLGSLKSVVSSNRVTILAKKSADRSEKENQEIAAKVEKMGWQFLKLSKPEISQLSRYYKNDILTKKYKGI